MADSGWLRFLGGTRSRTSRTLASPRSEPALRLLHQSSQSADDHGAQRKGISRLSSWHGLVRATSVAAEMNDEPAKEDGMAWHNPSVDQMAEALRVVMMTKSVLEPLSTEYYSHIMHVIEGYSLVKERTAAVEKELAETRALQQEEYEDYRAKQEDWMILEARYKAEVKRLELVIHRTSDTGLEAVALARSGSLLRTEKHNSAKSEGENSTFDKLAAPSPY
ncbi:hypothetical protein G7Z17_g12237 [Cylindrodendrum hubeiense]|uniref:Uncharacterized protein n=1 Tax=Cylindrodendrum hubeiense TaxID=595255 RepID=A0A9P5GUF5_9HYPO|nr:hypothetical protein G7Z17_g12237 [Cylindrodendrum hubeiense]